MKQYSKPVIVDFFQRNGAIPFAAAVGASVAKAFAVGAGVGLMMGGRRDIYTPAIAGINFKDDKK